MNRGKPRSPESQSGLGRWESLADGVWVRRMVEGSGSAIHLYRLESGRRFEEHEHPFAELGVVLSGRCVFRVGGEPKTVRGGDSFYFPAGVRHGCEVVSAHPSVILDVAVPLASDATDEISREVMAIARRTARAPARGKSGT